METVKIDYSEASKILKAKLKELGIELTDTDNYCIYNDNMEVGFASSEKYGWHRNYATVNLTIRTKSWGNRVRRYVKNLAIETGDYTVLLQKIKEIEALNEQSEKAEKQKDIDEKKAFKALLKKLKPYGGKQEYANTVEIKVNDDLRFTFYTGGNVRCDYYGDIDETIELIKKLK